MLTVEFVACYTFATVLTTCMFTLLLYKGLVMFALLRSVLSLSPRSQHQHSHHLNVP